jgi:hypothetical protein
MTLTAYQIKLRGYLDEDFAAAYCPPGTQISTENEVTTLGNLQTDQSGIIGLLRHLHGLGCTILELTTAKESIC